MTIAGLPTLEPSQIHVWFSDLDLTYARNGHLWPLLSEDERDRASRFRFDIHRSRFIAARATLRSLVGGYIGQSPRDVAFVYGPYGKPALPGDPLHFNVSHSVAGGLFAFTTAAPVGIDLEWVRPMSDILEIARRFFSPAEAQVLSDLSAEERTEAFFRFWTRKEAFIKTTGEGLSFPLDSFDVSLGEPPAVLRVAGDPASAIEWSLYHIEPAAGYVGSAAIRQPDCRLLFFGAANFSR